MVNGEPRDHYVKVFQDQGKDKPYLVVVVTQNGEAFNGFRIGPRNLNKLGARDGQGYQPPPVRTVSWPADGTHDKSKFNLQDEMENGQLENLKKGDKTDYPDVAALASMDIESTELEWFQSILSSPEYQGEFYEHRDPNHRTLRRSVRNIMI